MKSTIGTNNNVPSYSIELSGRLILTWVSINPSTVHLSVQVYAHWDRHVWAATETGCDRWSPTVSHAVQHTLWWWAVCCEQYVQTRSLCWIHSPAVEAGSDHLTWRLTRSLRNTRRWRPESRLVVVTFSCWMRMDDNDQGFVLVWCIL